MDIYQGNIQKYKKTLFELAEDLSKLSIIRLVFFVFSVIIIVVLINQRLIAFLSVVAPLCTIGFVLLVKRHNKVDYLKKHNTFLKEINEEEVLRLECTISNFPSGHKNIARDHPYVADLDVFGTHSLFQLINRTTTESGSLLLAEWLSEAASKDIILERQQAIKELTLKLDWRQHFQALGMHYKNPKSDFNKLLAWIERPETLLPNQMKYLVVCIFLSILSMAALIFHATYAYSSDYLTGTLPLAIILITNFFILRRVSPIAVEIIENTHQNVKILGGYQSLITKIESEKFHSKSLQRLQSVFNQNNYSAVNEINKLRKILEIFQLRGTNNAIEKNAFYGILNVFWLLDIYWIVLTEKWKDKNRSYLKSWASAVSEFEALTSLAGFTYSNPSFTFPEIMEAPYIINFEMLGHPLINLKNRVSNNFSLEGRGDIAMITGSNMAGKSTFLRTVGANLILALMGAPCCAKSGKVSNMKLFTSMRTQDNLEEGISSFYAELKRIEQLLKLIERGQPIFFLLDEMFKGTNSKDRNKGGFSLIMQLKELNAFGIISTHDLELASKAGKHMIVTNYSFNSEIRKGEMIFSYELNNGLCKDFNASELMKRVGIKILPSIEKI